MQPGMTVERAMGAGSRLNQSTGDVALHTGSPESLRSIPGFAARNSVQKGIKKGTFTLTAGDMLHKAAKPPNPIVATDQPLIYQGLQGQKTRVPGHFKKQAEYVTQNRKMATPAAPRPVPSESPIRMSNK